MHTTTPSDAVAARVREVRTRRGITAAELAERCTALGLPRFTAQSVYKIEGQRESESRPPRRVTVDELLALALALNVAPVNLLIPPDDIDAPYRVTAAVSEQAAYVREWIRGEMPLGAADPREFYAETDSARRYYDTEFGAAVAARQQAAARRRHDQESES